MFTADAHAQPFSNKNSSSMCVWFIKTQLNVVCNLRLETSEGKMKPDKQVLNIERQIVTS